MNKYYIATTSEPGCLRSLSYALNLDPSGQVNWHSERFVRFFTRDRIFLYTLNDSRRIYDFDLEGARSENSDLRNLTDQEKIMVEHLIHRAPYDSSEEVKARIHEIRDKEKIDELEGRFWR